MNEMFESTKNNDGNNKDAKKETSHFSLQVVHSMFVMKFHQ